MKDDERAYLDAIKRDRPEPSGDGVTAEDIGIRLGLAQKRALYLLDKWSGKGWWDYGVSLRTGWLTDAGKQA